MKWCKYCKRYITEMCMMCKYAEEAIEKEEESMKYVVMCTKENVLITDDYSPCEYSGIEHHSIAEAKREKEEASMDGYVAWIISDDGDMIV